MERLSNKDFNEQMRTRCKVFACDVIKFYDTIKKTDASRIIGKQLLRSATSVAANYRAACRGRSQADFYSKICIVTEEADETQFWLELLYETEIATKESVMPHYDEITEILAIVTSIKHKLSKKEPDA